MVTAPGVISPQDVFSKETLCCTQCARVWQSLDVSKTSLGEAVI